MAVHEVPPWVFSVKPYEGESISHFLGRFCRENHTTLNQLGQKTGLGAVLGRWSKFRLIPFPTEQELEALAQLVGVDAARLRLMLPPKGVGMRLSPIKVSGVCYAEEPYHRLSWQFKETRGCDRHQLKLFSTCPQCKSQFEIPFLWRQGHCQRCLLPFASMAEYQRPYRASSSSNAATI